MFRFRSEFIFKTFLQAAALALISVVTALAVNNFRAQGLPLIADWSPEARLKTATGDSLILAVVFLYASVNKILHPAQFAKAVYLYQILPGPLINLAALILPWLELVLGLCLVAGIWLPGAVLWSNALLWTFFAALVFNVIRGLNIHCGCFSTNVDPAGASLMTWYLFRDASFLLAGGYFMVYLFWIPRPSEDATGDCEGSSSG